MIGPELPPGFRPPGAPASGEPESPKPFIGPPLPPPLRKVYGPSIDPPCPASSGSSSDEDEYGPLPAGAADAAGDRAAAAFEEARVQAEKDHWAALRGEDAAADKGGGTKRAHEEWMTALPVERRGFGLFFHTTVGFGVTLLGDSFVCAFLHRPAGSKDVQEGRCGADRQGVGRKPRCRSSS